MQCNTMQHFYSHMRHRDQMTIEQSTVQIFICCNALTAVRHFKAMQYNVIQCNIFDAMQCNSMQYLQNHMQCRDQMTIEQLSQAPAPVSQVSQSITVHTVS